MRNVLRQRLSHMETNLLQSSSEKREITWLKQYIASPWIYFSPKAAGPCGLRIALFITPHVRSRALRDIVKTVYDRASSTAKTDAERSALTALLNLKSSDLRDGYASFIYDNSLFNILLVKRALGHGSLKSTRHYVRQKRHIAQRFREFRNFQDIFFDEVRRFQAVDPTILFLRARFDDLTDEQRSRLSDHRFRTRMDMGCVNPLSPPIDISGGAAGPCLVHRCTICQHGIVFEGSLPGLARRAAEIRLIRNRSASENFVNSSFHKEWIAIEIIIKGYFANVEDKFERMQQDHYDSIISGRSYLFDQIWRSL